MTLLNEAQYVEYFKPIMASINAVLDSVLDKIDAAEVLGDAGPPKEEVDKLREVVLLYEEMKQAFLKHNMTQMQENRLLIVLNQTRSNLKSNRAMLDKSISKMDSLIQICENAQKNQLKS